MIRNPEIWGEISFNNEIYKYIDFGVCQQICPKFRIKDLPFSLRVVLESNLRHAHDIDSVKQVLGQFAAWRVASKGSNSINIRPTRILLQDYTGIPVLVDLCALRHAVTEQSLDPQLVNPGVPVDLIVDHSIVVDISGTASAERSNAVNQYSLNGERFSFLKWAAQAFRNLRVVPPNSGICHQVNLESLAMAYVTQNEGDYSLLYPELVIGADSHTPMINSLGILGWGVGGIEALNLCLGGAIRIPMPEVIGVELHGTLSSGVTATDCVLTIVHKLRDLGVVNKFVEFCGDGIKGLTVPDRATIANMAPEYGATCAFFPWDEQCVHYLESTGRNGGALLSAFAKQASLWRDEEQSLPVYSKLIKLDLSNVEAVVAGPSRPEERRPLSAVPASFKALDSVDFVRHAKQIDIPHGAVLLAAITSCTNTANPSLVIAAGLLAKKAAEAGLRIPSWVKTSFAPGSLAVGEYLRNSGLQKYLDMLGFQICGYGCTTCIGNSGSLLSNAVSAIENTGLVGCAVLSGNRNFGGRIHPMLKYNYLVSPPLVVAYALAGRVTSNLVCDPIGTVKGRSIYLSDLWPKPDDIQRILDDYVTADLFTAHRESLTLNSPLWDQIEVDDSDVYRWNDDASYIALPPFLQDGPASEPPASTIENARALLILGDGITTDHISPAGRINETSAAGQYLIELGVDKKSLHTFGARRGNWKVMLRGAFSNVNLVNELSPNQPGAYTRVMPKGTILPLLAAAEHYKSNHVPVIIVAGKNYGTGSSRDDAARSTRLLGVSAVIAESFERIHRANLAALGVMPLLFTKPDTRASLRLNGSETFTINFGTPPSLSGEPVDCIIRRDSGNSEKITLISALQADESCYFKRGGMLPYLLSKLLTT